MPIIPFTTDPPWVHEACRLKFESGRSLHQGTSEAFSPGFDFAAAIAAEHIDIVNYADQAIEQGEATSDIRSSRAVSLCKLEQIGEEIVMRAVQSARGIFPHLPEGGNGVAE